jgi:glutathione synthase/RimK-type ligase-like ATP-grasp enzyme
MKKAVLFKSKERFDAFLKKMKAYGIEVTILDFDLQEWLDFDFSQVDFVIYYPTFEYSSNHPLALHRVYDNLSDIKRRFPGVEMFPDPKILHFYNDKYKQFLFLRSGRYPIAPTLPLFSHENIDEAELKFGYPMVVKNRYGAGGNSVFKVHNRKELKTFFKFSTLNLWDKGVLKHLATLMSKRIFYYHLIKARCMPYPFLSPPLLAQKYITHDHDLKTVVGNYNVVEAHWRRKAHGKMWKVNIDDGGIGEWSYVPDEPIDLSIRLAGDLQTRWLNLDFMISEGKYLISEFSPVWHHYAYREKPSFIYKDDYNIEPALEVSLDLERIIVESLLGAVKERAAV